MKFSLKKGFVGQRNKLIIELFYVTGIRLSELINIKISDVDLNKQSIKVLGKRNKERIIPLSSNVVNDLNIFIENNQKNKYLFTNLEGDKLYNKLVYRLVNKYIAKISSVNKKSPAYIKAYIRNSHVK